MAAITTWSTTASSNNSAPPDGWPENQSPSSVNNCAREMMAAIKAGCVKVVATIAAMTALTKANLGDNEPILVLGYTSDNDGGGGHFFWDSSSSDTADSGLTFASDEGGDGQI